MECDRKLENVKQSLKFLLDFLTPQDSVSVVTFSETAKTILAKTMVSGTERDNMRARISVIRVESNTNLSAGIIQACGCLQTDAANIKQGILLLTDGIANVGLTRSHDILELVRNTIGKFPGTSISSVGYGTDHNVEMLQSISTEGGGSYYVVNTLEDVATVFGDILGGLLSCAAQQVCVCLPTGTEVKSRYGMNVVGDKMEIIIGDLPAGAEAAFLAKIPIGQTVTLKGYDLVTHNIFELNSAVNTTDDIMLQTNGEAHYLRFEVMALLEESRHLISHFTSSANTQIAKIDACITTINNYRTAHEHTLWGILLDELNTCKHNLQNRRHIHVHTPHIMTQHAGYLGRMRGIPAALSQPRANYNETDEDPNTVLEPIPLGRTFSNYVQRQISSQLCSTVGVAAHQLSAPLGHYTPTQDPMSGHCTPMSQLSPIMRPSNITTIPETCVLLDSLPIPAGPIARQVAHGCISRSTSDGIL
jgi:hypothetical protein